MEYRISNLWPTVKRIEIDYKISYPCSVMSEVLVKQGTAIYISQISCQSFSLIASTMNVQDVVLICTPSFHRWLLMEKQQGAER